jgi:hypothetical protein
MLEYGVLFNNYRVSDQLDNRSKFRERNRKEARQPDNQFSEGAFRHKLIFKISLWSDSSLLFPIPFEVLLTL